MRSNRIVAFCGAAVLAGAWAVAPTATLADSNVLFIFDASGSMKKKLDDGNTRISVAKTSVGAALAEIPGEVRLGLLLYGHRRAKDCSDIELVAPIGADDAAKIAARVETVEARGETPIAEALKQGLRSFAALKGQTNRVVLVTDGIEECGGDPCAAAREVVDAGLGLKVDVVGFTLNAEQRATVQCVADLTGGTYHDAQNVTGLAQAFAEVKREVTEPAAAPPEPAKPKEYFRDDFEGKDLAEAWEVLQPNPGAFVVENGELLVVGPGKAASLVNDDVANVFRLSESLPEGDWTLTARILPQFQTGNENIMIGLHESKESFLVSQLYIEPDPYYGHKFSVGISKRAGADETNFAKLIFRYGCNVCGADKDISRFVADVSKPVLLSISKQGRSYSASAQWEGTDDAGAAHPVFETEKVTSLRSAGSPMIGVAQRQDSGGESLIKVDWIKIDTPK